MWESQRLDEAAAWVWGDPIEARISCSGLYVPLIHSDRRRRLGVDLDVSDLYARRRPGMTTSRGF